MNKLKKEIGAVMKKLEDTEQELNEAYSRMSGIVQKKNAPNEELATKAQELEKSLAQAEAEKAKINGRM